MIIAVSFEILAIILSKGVLLIIQTFVVGGLSFIGFDTSKRVYDEEKKLKASNREIDIEIENTEAELKIARGNLDAYVKSQEKKFEEKSVGNEKSFSNNLEIVNDFDYSDDRSSTKVRSLGKGDNNRE